MPTQLEIKGQHCIDVLPYISIEPCQKFGVKCPFRIKFPASKIGWGDEHMGTMLSDPQYSAAVCITVGVGSKQYGLKGNSQIVYNGEKVYKRLTMKDIGKTVSSGLKWMEGGLLCWGLAETGLPIELVTDLLARYHFEDWRHE